jgi:DNA-binding MarR family transcriptional regulator
MALQFLSPIHKASRQVALYLQGSCADLDCSTTEAHVLSYLRSYNPAPVSELHRVFGVKRSTLTGVLDRLERGGWLVREPSRRDRRAILVALTDDGHAGAERVQAAVEELEAAIAARTGARDVAGFNAVISAIAAATSPSTR